MKKIEIGDTVRLKRDVFFPLLGETLKAGIVGEVMLTYLMNDTNDRYAEVQFEDTPQGKTKRILALDLELIKSRWDDK